MLKITAPERVCWDLSREMQLRCAGDSLYAGGTVLTAVRVETGKVRSAAAVFTGQAGLLDVRHCLNIPWKDGTFLVTLLRRDQASNRVQIRLEKSDFAFRDPEVEKFVQRNRRRSRPVPIWPGPGNVVAGSGPGLPHYRRLPDSPEVPPQIGIALSVHRTVVRGSFRLPVLDIDIVSASDPSQGTSRYGYLRATAIVPITLLMTSHQYDEPIQFNLGVPSYSDIAPASVKDRTVNGFFAVDLEKLGAATPLPETGFIYAFGGESMAGPVPLISLYSGR